MTNLFGLVSTDPGFFTSLMSRSGLRTLDTFSRQCKVIAAWGARGAYKDRGDAVLERLTGREVICLKETKEGYPIHPLYVAGTTVPKSYKPDGVAYES